MRMRRQIVDQCSVERATDNAKSYIQVTMEQALNATNDPRKSERLAKQECVYCFYMRSGIGGAVLSDRQCGLCDKLVHSCNTAVDTICQECAKAHELCKNCGADIKLRIRRKFDGKATPSLPD